MKTKQLRMVAKIERKTVAPEQIKSGEIYVGLENIDGSGKFQNVSAVSSGDLESTKFLFSREHILYGKLRPYLKKIARPNFKGICSTDILPISVGPEIDRDYLYFFLRQPSMVDLATTRCTGANLPRLSPKTLEEFLVPLPPLPEQRRIAAILDKADAIRRKRQLAIEKCEDFLRSVFLDMFGDPVTNPKGWSMSNFGGICETRLGKMLDSKKQTGNFLRPYLRNTNVQWGNFYLTEVFQMDFDEKDRAEFILKYGDILVCEGGEVGRSAIWRNELSECYFQKALHRVRVDSKFATPEYIASLMYFLAKHGGLSDHVTSATIAHLTGIKLKNMSIPMPPIKLQREYSDIEEKHRCNLVKLNEIKKLTRNLFASLTHLAFRGELTNESADTLLKEAAAG